MAEKTCGTCGNGNDCTQRGCTCPGPVNNYNNMRCSGTPEDAGVGAIRVKSRAIPMVKGKTSMSRYMPTFVYTADSSYLGDKLEESPWWIFGGGECRNACSGHPKRSDAWNECMDVCGERDTSNGENGGGGFWDNLGDLFKKPSASDCAYHCENLCIDQIETGGDPTWECTNCMGDCEDTKSEAGEFVEQEGGLFAVLDKLGGIIQKIRGRGSIDANGNGNGWKPDTRKDRNTKMIWGAIILVFIILIIGFLVFMARKKK